MLSCRYLLYLLLLFSALPICAQSSSIPAAPSSQAQISAAPPQHLAPELGEVHRLIEQGRFSDAVGKLQELQKIHPEMKGIHHELGLAYYRQSDFVHAQEEFAKATEEDPNDHEAVQLRGISLFQTGRAADAIPLLKQLQAWAPETSVESSYVLALAYIQTRGYENARLQAARMYGVPPDSAASHLLIARLLLRQGIDPIAEASAQKAIVLDPKLPLAHFLLGEYYLYKSDIPKSIQELEQELKLNPGYAATYDRLADAYIRSGRYGDAEKLLQRSFLLDANSTGAYILMGKVQIKKQDYQLATLYLRKAVKMDPNNFISHHLLGEAYRGMGRSEDAERELKAAEQLQSSQHPQLENVR